MTNNNNTTDTTTDDYVDTLNAFYDPKVANKDENKTKFSLMRGVTYDGSVASQFSGYSSRASYSNALSDVQALFSDIPIKTTLKIQGFAMVEGKTINYNKSDSDGKMVKITTYYEDPYERKLYNEGNLTEQPYKVVVDEGNYTRHAQRILEEPLIPLLEMHGTPVTWVAMATIMSCLTFPENTSALISPPTKDRL